MPFRDVDEAVHQREAQLVSTLRELSEQAARAQAALAEVRREQADRDQLATPHRLTASSCGQRWEEMVGDDRVRECGRCGERVYNIEALTQRQARELVGARDTPLGLWRRRRDGTVIAGECPEGARGRRRRRMVGVAIVAGAGLSGGAATAPPVPANAAPRERRLPIDGSESPTPRPLTDNDRAAMQDAFGAPSAPSAPDASHALELPRPVERAAVQYHATITRETLNTLMNRATVQRGPTLVVERSGNRGVLRIPRVTEGSTLYRLGMRSGDRIVSLNGHSLHEPKGALAAYSILGQPATRAILEVERRGLPVFFTFAIE